MIKFKTPTYLTYFVTNRCQLNCTHCFYHRHINQKMEELNPDKIEKVAKSLLYPLELLIITGGEPFLRNDLGDVCYIFSYFNRTKLININTNGWSTDGIYNVVKKIWNKIKYRTNLNIQISLDGFKKTHDKMRGDGAFQNAVDTINKLRTIKGVGISIMTTICKLNYKEIEDLIIFIKELNIKHKFQFLRGNQRNTFNLKKKLLADFYPRCKNFFLSTGDLMKINSLINRFEEDNRQKLKREISLENMIARGKIWRATECLAGRQYAVLYPDGGVSFCEPLKSSVNLRDFDYNFEHLWQSKEVDTMRGEIKKCSCSDPCSLLVSLYPKNI